MRKRQRKKKFKQSLITMKYYDVSGNPAYIHITGETFLKLQKHPKLTFAIIKEDGQKHETKIFAI